MSSPRAGAFDALKCEVEIERCNSTIEQAENEFANHWQTATLLQTDMDNHDCDCGCKENVEIALKNTYRRMRYLKDRAKQAKQYRMQCTTLRNELMELRVAEVRQRKRGLAALGPEVVVPQTPLQQAARTIPMPELPARSRPVRSVRRRVEMSSSESSEQ